MNPDRSRTCALEIVRDSKLWDDVPDVETTIEAAVAAAFAQAGLSARPDAELALTLSDDAYVRELNEKWRGVNAATNVLSFPAFEADETADAAMLGDVILAFETIEREARDEAKPFAHHLSHLVIHGVLHLFGYDHLDEDEAEKMEAIETRALARLGVPDPYASLDAATVD